MVPVQLHLGSSFCISDIHTEFFSELLVAGHIHNACDTNRLLHVIKDYKSWEVRIYLVGYHTGECLKI